MGLPDLGWEGPAFHVNRAAVQRWPASMLSRVHTHPPVLSEYLLSPFWIFNLIPSSKWEGTDALMENQPWGQFLASEI